MYYVTEDEFKVLITQFLLPECSDYTCATMLRCTIQQCNTTVASFNATPEPSGLTSRTTEQEQRERGKSRTQAHRLLEDTTSKGNTGNMFLIKAPTF